MKTIAFTTIFLATFSSFSTAQIFSCKTPSGVEFSDAPCKNSKGKEIYVRPNVIDRSEGRIQDNHAKQQAEIREYREAQLNRMERELQAEKYNSDRRSSLLTKQEAEALYKDATTQKHGESGRNFRARSEAIMDYLETSGSRPNLDKTEHDRILRDVTTKRSSETSKQYQSRMEAGIRYLGSPKQEKRKPGSIVSCTTGGCFDDLGNFYNGTSNTLFNDRGDACQKEGDRLVCRK